VHARRADEEDGQVFPALLLVVVVLLLGALALAQLGSASDQRGQTQTAADAAAVAAAHEVLAAAVAAAPTALPPGLISHLGLNPVVHDPAAQGCDAALRNWNLNAHRSSLSCHALRWSFPAPNSVAVTLDAPAGEVVDGPARSSGTAARAAATARVIFRRCPDAGNRLADAVVGTLVDAVARELGQGDAGCGPAHGLQDLLTPPSPSPPPSPSVSPPALPLPQPTPSPVDLSGVPSGAAALDAVLGAFRVEIVD
jgi:type II secretory pathway pseudopilin PulG